MSDALLSTKLHIPRLRPGAVPRPRLIERLNGGLSRKLTLVSAPAGFGKTTLVIASIQQCGQPVAWLSLDESDNDPGSFLAYFIAALQTLALRGPPSISRGQVEGIDVRQVPAGNIGEEALHMLQSPQPPSADTILTVLINEVAATPKEFVLVLDDYHLVESQPVHEVLAFLLAHMPPQMHLVITTRSDPFFLPLSRLRARGQMIDIRADDLRFTPEEAATFLNQVMGLALSSDQVAALETRTEGWIAGLHLAALSMQGQDDTAAFISAFTGDDRYVGDYLMDEVLARQPKGTQDFLLQTSILERLTGPLCDAVRFGRAKSPSSSAERAVRFGFAESPSASEGTALTGRESGRNVLRKLEQANLFIVPLDNQRRWYRYHHLFADLLRQRLEESTPPREIASLHRRASQWYDENGFLIKAVEHGLAADDYEDVIRLIRQGAQDMLMRGQQNILLGWWAQLPQELIASQPKLCMAYAWAWVATGHPGEAERCLQMIEQTLGAGMDALFPESETETADPTIRGALAEVSSVRAQLAIGQGDIPEALKLTRLALPYLEDDEGPYLLNTPLDSRLVVFFIMGVAQKLNGELGSADGSLSAAAVLGQERGNLHVVAAAYGHLASVQAIQGRLYQAVGTCQQGLLVIQEMAGQRSPMFGLLKVELGNLLYERNDLEAAQHHLQEGISLAEPWRYRDALLPGYTGLARLRAARGDWGGAFTALDELATFGKDSPQAVMPAVESFRARLWAAQGQADAARRWAQAAGLDADGEIDFLREGQFIILVRVQMVQKKWDEAARLIGRLLDTAETGQRWGHVIELLILRALALDAQGKQGDALAPLARALALAEPEGYVRIFVDEGEPIRSLISDFRLRMVQQAPESDSQSLTSYADRLLAAFGGATKDEGRKMGLSPSSAVLGQSSLVEPLSRRELEILRLLQTELSGPEIAQELTIALSTMRFHTRNIYGKLGAHNRMQAVARAEDLGLL